MTSLAERILLGLSRSPGDSDYSEGVQSWSLDNALTRLYEAYPDLDDNVRGKDIVDFGCGQGYQAVGLLGLGAKSVLGVDTNLGELAEAQALAEREGVTDRVGFVPSLGEEHAGRYDVVISQNAMEHFPDPAAILATMTEALRPGGQLWITFGPPWFAPYGSHMHFFTKMPWVNLFFSERTVMNVRNRFRSDGATRYEDVESGLNRMTVRKFERLVRESRLTIRRRNYQCVKGINALARIPVLRELFINRLNCILVPR